MPIIDKDIGVDKAEYKISKRGLDPFNQQKQALDYVKRNLTAPVQPNMAGLEYGIEDRGDYYKVTVKQKQRRAGPGAIPGARGTPGRTPEWAGGDNSKAKGKGPEGNPGEAKGHDKNRGLNRASEVGALRVDRPLNRSSGRQGQGETGTFDIVGTVDSLYSKPELMAMARDAGINLRDTASKGQMAREFVSKAPYEARRMVGRL